MLFGGESADEAHDGPALGRPQLVQCLAAAGGVKARGVDAAAPPVEAGDAVSGQVVYGGGGGGEGAVAREVDGAGPRPGGVAHDAHPVGVGEAGDVGLVDGDGRHIEGAGGGGSGGTEDERGGQVHHVGGEVPQGVVDARAGGADGQRGDDGDAHGGDAVDGEPEVVVALGGHRVGPAEDRGESADERVRTEGVGGALPQADVA